MSPRKTTSGELTKELIIQKARTQFVEKGFQQVSMRSIAKLLDCSHGAIYYHFKNKAELFYTIVEEDFSKLNSLLDEAIKGPEDDATKLFHVLIAFIEFGLNNQSQYEIMFLIRNTEVDSLSHEAANHSYQKFGHTVQALLKEKVGILELRSVFIALHGFVSHYYGYVDNFEDVKLAAQSHVKFIIKGLTS